MVKILNTCILSILVYNLFWDKQHNILYTMQNFHTRVYWLSSWDRNSKNLIGRKRLDTKLICCYIGASSSRYHVTVDCTHLWYSHVIMSLIIAVADPGKLKINRLPNGAFGPYITEHNNQVQLCICSNNYINCDKTTYLYS